jgi:hypothetical protein
MRRTILLGLLAAATAVSQAASARAEVIVNTPWVSVRVGRPGPQQPTVAVDTPWASVRVGRPVPLPPPGEVDPPPVPVPPPSFDPPPVPIPPPGETVVAPAPRAMTVEEFAATFQPRPGNYEAVLTHPLTGGPVKVCFTLPAGRVKKVHVHPRSLQFDYGLLKEKVTIRFFPDGDVRVDY